MPRCHLGNLLTLVFAVAVVFYVMTVIRMGFFYTEENRMHLIANEMKLKTNRQKNTKFNKKRTTAVLHKPKEITTHSIKETKGECELLKHQYFPLCEEKFQYLNQPELLPCYREKHGVKPGQKCSILKYLQKVEPFCPDYSKQLPSSEYATARFDLEGLLELLPKQPYRWMRDRVKQMWQDWVAAGRKFQTLKQKWRKKNVLLFMGSMGFQPVILEMAGKGGPLGELVQWTDLLMGLYVLGYNVQLQVNTTNVRSLIDKDSADGCATGDTLQQKLDVIYTDSNGFKMMLIDFGPSSTAKYRCMLRVLDSFGTYPEYNYPSYPHEIPGGRSEWANANLLPMQFLTLFPHTPDNSFLGFVVPNSEVKKRKENIALVYAKHAFYLEGMMVYIKVISEYFEVHATAVPDMGLPAYIYNHGPVSGSKVKQLLLKSKLFIGVGFPYEGPGPLEAMAAGTVFIQPKYKEPRDKFNDDFFKDKPTLRKLSSQSPYMEHMVGEPYSYTIDVNNQQLLRNTLQKIKLMNGLPPKIPREFSSFGMLERIHVFTEHMDFCSVNAPRYPPVDKLRVYLAPRALSCQETCWRRGLVCERTFFADINSKETMERHTDVKCSQMRPVQMLHAPSLDPVSRTCFLQAHAQIFSCAGTDANVKRLCPCRDYVKEQVQLCEGCL